MLVNWMGHAYSFNSCRKFWSSTIAFGYFMHIFLFFTDFLKQHYQYFSCLIIIWMFKLTIIVYFQQSKLWTILKNTLPTLLSPTNENWTNIKKIVLHAPLHIRVWLWHGRGIPKDKKTTNSFFAINSNFDCVTCGL